jgi:DNA-binding PadR family transcriptional regulator
MARIGIFDARGRVKENAMSSTTRMLVLGVVRLHQPVHGYDVRRELITWHAEEWGSVAGGSIYNALKTMAKEGLLESAGTDQVEGRPERTLYTITQKGERELSELCSRTLWEWRMPTDPLVAVISMMPFIKRDELIAGLEARAAKIKGDALHSEYAIAAIDDTDTPAHVREMLRLINARVVAELPWAEAFIARLRKGEYRTLGDPPRKAELTRPNAVKKWKAAAPKKAKKAARAR